MSDVDCALIEPDKLAGALLDSPGKSVDAWRGLRIADCGLRIADCGLRAAMRPCRSPGMVAQHRLEVGAYDAALRGR
ncbi:MULTISPECIES: hypothetical protein [unclassified Streptomyces]|uniref:hypothetical protein n=1 Tax=unclassified Streptomyces TaxID=2593676 RepID=UPI00115FEAFB|nr:MULTISPECIES: hypothetical protein [unclassified Streptomyces]